MRYYKFVDEYYIEEYTKPYVCVDGSQISYPSKEVLLKAGIKPLAIAPMPEYNKETQYLQYRYVDGESEITEVIEVYDYPADEVITDELADT